MPYDCSLRNNNGKVKREVVVSFQHVGHPYHCPTYTSQNVCVSHMVSPPTIHGCCHYPNFRNSKLSPFSAPFDFKGSKSGCYMDVYNSVKSGSFCGAGG